MVGNGSMNEESSTRPALNRAAPLTSSRGQYATTSSLMDRSRNRDDLSGFLPCWRRRVIPAALIRSEEHTSELQSIMRTTYAVFCLKKKKTKGTTNYGQNTT